MDAIDFDPAYHVAMPPLSSRLKDHIDAAESEHNRIVETAVARAALQAFVSAEFRLAREEWSDCILEVCVADAVLGKIEIDQLIAKAAKDDPEFMASLRKVVREVGRNQLDEASDD